MQFEGQNRYEWIYRGSTRLGPLFKEKQSNGTAAAPATIPRVSTNWIFSVQNTSIILYTYADITQSLTIFTAAHRTIRSI